VDTAVFPSGDEPQVSKCLVKMAPPKAEEKKLGHLLLIIDMGDFFLCHV
jgi:hypothetical protein